MSPGDPTHDPGEGRTAMAQPDGYQDGRGYDDDRRSAAPRIAGLAGLVVLAVVFARARAAGMTPPVHPPSGSATQVIIRIVALTVMVAAGILLVGGRRIRKIQVPGAGAQAKKVVGKPSRRVVIAALVGLLFAFAMQILGNTVNEQKRPPPPSESVQPQENESQFGRQPAPPQAEAEPGIADEVILVAALLTLGVLIVVLVRRRAEILEEDPADDDHEAMSKAMRAARAAVRDREITDPRSAIVACFAAMEDALADRGGVVTPQDSDTPSEVLYRGIERASLPEAPALTLLRLFREARFSTHPITEDDRGDADASLGELLRALGSPAGERSGGAR